MDKRTNERGINADMHVNTAEQNQIMLHCKQFFS